MSLILLLNGSRAVELMKANTGSDCLWLPFMKDPHKVLTTVVHVPSGHHKP